jgi:hypothetical protein
MNTRHNGPRSGIKVLFRSWRLRREAHRTLTEFQNIAEAMGHAWNSQSHSEHQLKRLARLREIAAELRALRFPHLTGGAR